MIDVVNGTEKERELLVQCVADAHEALRLLPGVEANGPALVWLAEHLLEAHRRTDRRKLESHP